MKAYFIFVVVVVASLNAFWRYEVVSHRPSLRAVDAGVELDGRIRRRHVGRHGDVETRIEGTPVICVGSSTHGRFDSCPLDRPGEGAFVRASIVEVPTLAGGIFVIKSLRLDDGTSYLVSGEVILADWESSANLMEIAATAILTIAFTLFRWVYFFGSFMMPAYVTAVDVDASRVRSRRERLGDR